MKRDLTPYRVLARVRSPAWKAWAATVLPDLIIGEPPTTPTDDSEADRTPSAAFREHAYRSAIEALVSDATRPVFSTHPDDATLISTSDDPQTDDLASILADLSALKDAVAALRTKLAELKKLAERADR